jgi:DNA-binding transcriptional LysR family regulator
MQDSIDIASMRAFVSVVDAHSFTSGARRIGLTRSAIGKAVVRLETTLGTRLLHRSTRSVDLTADGQVFYERAVQILQDVDDVQDLVAVSGRTPRGVLRLTAPEAFGQQVVLPILGEFLAAWPQLTAEVSFTDRVTDIVDEGFDIAIRFGSGPFAADLISKVIARSTAKLCASPSYLASYGMIKTIEDLKGHRHLASGTRDNFHAWQLEASDGSVQVVPMKPTIVCDSASALRQAALGGLGIAFLPRFLIDRDVSEGHLQIVLPGLSKTSIPISLVYPTRKHMAPKVRLFIQMLEDRLPFNPL